MASPPEQSNADVDSELDSEKIYQEMYQNSLIPEEAMPKWDDLGIELGFSYGEINIIKENAADKSVQICALDMLKKWRQQDGSAATPEKLIKALQDIEKNSDAQKLQKALDKGTFKEDYRDNKIAKLIAPYWDDVGIQLGVAHLRGIMNINNPTEHKFKEMLLNWLDQQTCSKREIYVKFHKALIEIQLITPAENFKEKVYQALNFYI